MLNTELIRYATKDRVIKSPLVQSIFNGGFTKEQYTRYLIDVFHYATHSAIVIGQGGCRLIHSHPELADYLLRHATEEMGHEHWAHSDLSQLGLEAQLISASKPSRPCLDMIAHEYFYAFHGNPVGLFGWMYTLESLGGDDGTSIARAIDARLKLDGKATKFLSGHGEADTHHSSELREMIQRHITRPGDIQAFETMAEISRDCYAGIMNAAFAPYEGVNA